MKVAKGFSEEMKPDSWARCDVELDEGDLERLKIEHGVHSDLTLAQGYGILSYESERLLTIEYITSLQEYEVNVPQSLFDRIAELQARVLDNMKHYRDADATDR